MWQFLAALALFASRVAGHGWVTHPMSKNEMASRLRNNHNNWPRGMPQEFRYGPDDCARRNVCGASSAASSRGLDVWQKWYDAAGLSVPVLTPGSDMRVDVTLTAEHGGQAWMMIACGVQFSENMNWTILERAQSDRSVGFLPSNPGIYTWTRGGGGSRYWHVPSWFSCPSGEAVGRWVWKTGNSCNDYNNLGTARTESFSRSESNANGGTRAETCTSTWASGGHPETFIACIDFRMNGSGTPTPAPPPTPPPPPTPAPVTPAPTPAPVVDCGSCTQCLASNGVCYAQAESWCRLYPQFTWCGSALMQTQPHDHSAVEQRLRGHPRLHE